MPSKLSVLQTIFILKSTRLFHKPMKIFKVLGVVKYFPHHNHRISDSVKHGNILVLSKQVAGEAACWGIWRLLSANLLSAPIY